VFRKIIGFLIAARGWFWGRILLRELSKCFFYGTFWSRLIWRGCSYKPVKGNAVHGEMKKFIFMILLCGVLSVMSSDVQAAPGGPPSDALWWVTSGCAYAQKYVHTSVPCEKVNLKRGYALVKDLQSKTQFLLVPLERIVGIESPEILEPNSINYWRPAWKARKYISDRAGKELPDDDIGLAVNSSYSRTQNQLHIHIDCLKPEVIKALKGNDEEETGKWFTIHFPQPLHGYQALYVDSLKTDPFKLVAEDTQHMARKTIAVAHVDDRFIILARSANLKNGDVGSSEELLDHECKVAN